VLRAALDVLAVRLDGRRAAANTVARKRAVFHNALGYAGETGLLDANPADQVSWRPPKASGAVNPQVMASAAQARHGWSASAPSAYTASRSSCTGWEARGNGSRIAYWARLP
jgi:hypothetical protein